MIYLRLFFEFFKAGLFAVGGGLATLPFLYDMAEKTGWFTAETVMDMIAISESTPGPIGVNMATYAGFTTAGVLGSVCATVGLVFPSVIIIIFVYKMLEKFKGSKLVNDVFYGLRPAVAGLVGAAGFQAECLVTACPLCKYNLGLNGQLPVVYFTELLAEALGIKEAQA